MRVKAVKALPVEEKEKNLEKDFPTVKSFGNIYTQKCGENSLPVKACRNCSNGSFYYNIQLEQSSDHGICTQSKSPTVWFTSKWELLSKC